MSTITISASDATFVRDSAPTTNFNSYSFLDCGKYSNGDLNRIFLNFDLTPVVGATINSASLSFSTYWVIEIQPYTNLNYDVYEANSIWSAGSITWNTQPGLVGGILLTCNIGNGGTGSGGDVTTAVQGALIYDTKIAFGVLSDDEAGTTAGTIFYSGKLTSHEPQLTIDYSFAPPPTTGFDPIWMGLM